MYGSMYFSKEWKQNAARFTFNGQAWCINQFRCTYIEVKAPHSDENLKRCRSVKNLGNLHEAVHLSSCLPSYTTYTKNTQHPGTEYYVEDKSEVGKKSFFIISKDMSLGLTDNSSLSTYSRRNKLSGTLKIKDHFFFARKVSGSSIDRGDHTDKNQ